MAAASGAGFVFDAAFHGTDRRRGVGVLYMQVTLARRDHRHADGGEISITRRKGGRGAGALRGVTSVKLVEIRDCS